MLEKIDIAKYYDIAVEWVLTYTPKIIWALVVLWIGLKISNFLGNLIIKWLKKQKIDITIVHFLSSLIKNVLKALVIVATIWILWVETSSFVAMFAAVWLAIGMALSWTLSHFASWVMILLFKPYKVWDLVETSGHFWTVKELQIFNTILTTLDWKTIIIPNADAISGSIVNYSIEKKKRLDITVWISYNSSMKKAKEILEKIIKNNKLILQNENNIVWVKNLWDSSVDLAFNVWTKTEDYWDLYFNINEEIKDELDKAKIEIPFPQRDIHLFNEK